MKRICGDLRRLVFPLVAAAVALACAALLAGCKKETQLKIGEKAPELAALDLNYRTVKLSDFRGKVVVLRFWSTGCKACIAEMPKIDEFSKRYRDRGLAVVAVNVGDTKEKVADFAKSLKISYPVLLDEANITARKYRVATVPTTCFIDRNGIAKKIVFGEMIQGQMEKTVRELLYTDFASQLQFKDVTALFFDGPKDLFKYYLGLAAPQAGRKPADVTALFVTSYYTLAPIDGLKAYYVTGSDVSGPMGRELIAFEKEADAREFKKDHKGKAVLRFQEVSPAIVKELDR